MSLPAIKRIRSFLFVPGNKPSMIEKSVNSKADALILDLEDSVPPNAKEEAREIVKSKLAWLGERKQRVYVRINKSPYIHDFNDISAVVGPHIEGVMIPKTIGPEDVDTVSMMLSEAEYRQGLPVGTTRIMPLFETARSLQFAYEIAMRERVPALVGASAKNADISRSLNYVWTADGRESLYFKSRVVMAARAAGKLTIGGIWQQVHDLEGLKTWSQKDRELGYMGQLLLHPTNVPVVNEIYSPSAEEVAYYKGMIAAVEKAQAEGRASTIYDGEHVDIAHMTTAREIVALAESFKD